MPLAPGDQFDRYTIESIVGEGGMGRVFVAFDTRLRRRVALKVLRGELLEDSSGGPSNLLREARAAAALTHPNVVSIYDVGELDGEPYIAMELVKGRPLRDYIGDATVSLVTRLRWLSDLASALGAAHVGGLVHRDVKPTNIMIRSDLTLKVFDFGIARITRWQEGSAPDDAPTLTNGDGIVGTPRYMAPEQIRGGEVTGRSDQFAFGVIAYQLLTGVSPWNVTAPDGAVVAAVLTQLVISPHLRDQNIPEALSLIVMRALERAAEDRYERMEHIVQALHPFVFGAESEPPVGGTGTQMLAPVQKRANPSEKPASITPPPTPPATLPPAPSPTAKSARPTFRAGRTILLVLVFLSAAFALAVTAYRIGPRFLASRAQDDKPKSSPSPPPVVAIPIPDLPKPVSGNSDALAAFALGMQALRDGANRSAMQDFERAVSLDPAFSAAHLRLAIYEFYSSPTDAREHFRTAVFGRAALSERDRTLLDAVDPYIGGIPSNHDELVKRLNAAVASYPGDAELTLLLAYFSTGEDESESIETARFDRAIKLDPAFGLAYGYKAQSQSYWGDFDGAYATIEACAKGARFGTLCLHMRDVLDEHLGDCARVKQTARQLIATEPQSDNSYFVLAEASYATGGSPEAVEAALSQSWQRVDEKDRAATEARYSFALHVLLGKLALADADAKLHEKLVGADASLAAHAVVARERVDVSTEMGRTEEAAKAADEYLHHREAWVPDPRAEDFAIGRDPAPLMLAASLRGGHITRATFEAQRKAWVEAWKGSVLRNFAPFIWLHGYAATAQTKEDGERAIAELPGFLPIPRYAPRTLAAADIGHVYLLAGRVDEALPYLKAATESCYAITEPILHTRAELWLGSAREAKGDRAGACAAYAIVIARWGDAGPRSATAAKAKERGRALGCH